MDTAIIFLSCTKSLGLAQYVNKFLVRQKKFGPAQNILGPVEGQGKSNFKKRREMFFKFFGLLTISKLYPYGFVIFVQFVMSKLEFLRMQLTTFFAMTMGLIGL